MEILITGVLGTVTQTGEATHFQQDPILIPPKATAGEHSWFAVQTKPRHEKRVATELEEKGVVRFPSAVLRGAPVERPQAPAGVAFQDRLLS